MAHVGLLNRLHWGRTARLVAEALASARATDGPVLVSGLPGLARVLAERGLEVQAAASSDPDAPRLAAVVLRGTDGPDDALRRSLRPGAALVRLTSPPATEQSRRALAAGLVDLEQRRAGRILITSGRTTRF
jgi:hypothetical protein